MGGLGFVKKLCFLLTQSHGAGATQDARVCIHALIPFEFYSVADGGCKYHALRATHISRAQHSQSTEVFVVGSRSSTAGFSCLQQHCASIMQSHMPASATNNNSSPSIIANCIFINMRCPPNNPRTLLNSLDGLADGLNNPHLQVMSPTISSSTSSYLLRVRRLERHPEQNRARRTLKEDTQRLLLRAKIV